MSLQQELKVNARVTQGEKKEQLLADMKDRVTTEEIELDKVLYSNSKDVHKQFPDADLLLAQVSSRNQEFFLFWF